LGYATGMPDWLQNPQASYVLAAYGAAALALFGLLLFSWRAWRCRQTEWRRVQEKRTNKS